MDNELREKLATYAHKSWSGWMKYLFSETHRMEDGGSLIPPESAERWRRQMNTDYADLPESEKKSDREEAYKMLGIIIGSPNYKLIAKGRAAPEEEEIPECLACDDPYMDCCCGDIAEGEFITREEDA